jgi:hypothetical protein
MTIRKISDHQTKSGIRLGISEWVIINDGRSTTFHGTKEEAERLDKPSKPKSVEREVKVVSQTHSITVKDAALKVFGGGGFSFTPREVAEKVNQEVRVGTPAASVRRAISELVAEGRVIKNAFGRYARLGAV